MFRLTSNLHLMPLIYYFIQKELLHFLLLRIIFTIQVRHGRFYQKNQVNLGPLSLEIEEFLAANAFGPIPRDIAESLLDNGQCLLRRCGDFGQFDSFFITSKSQNGEFSHFKMKKMKNGYYSSPGDDQELFMNHDYDQIKTLSLKV